MPRTPINWENVARALVHEAQIRVLDLLAERNEPTSPKEAALALGVGLSSASYHFKRLYGVGLIELHHAEPRRGAMEHYYTLTTTRPG